jgi:inhibitor of cysteine peptidase
LVVTSWCACRAAKPPQAAYTDPNVALQVRVGQAFALTLESNRTTGYQWELAEPLNGAILKLANSEYKAPGTTRVGTGGHEVWTFQSVGKGKTKIALKYVRPWEKSAAPARSETFEVIIR